MGKNKKSFLMLYYDFFQDPNMFNSLDERIKYIGNNKILIDKITYIESELDLPYFCPIKLHSRYIKEQILSGFGQNSFQKKSSSREGVLNIKVTMEVNL